MTRGVLCGRSACLIAALLLTVPLLAGANALPDLFPVATTVDVGDVGVDEQVPFAATEGGILVAPGQRLTFTADYAFEDSGLPSGETFQFSATLRIQDATGTLDTVSTSTSVTTGGALQESGTLEVDLGVPEGLRDATVTLESSLFRAAGQGSTLIGKAYSTAPLSIVALPEPVTFLTEDLVVGPALDLGSIEYTGSVKDVNATAGHTFVSTELGARFVATVVAEQPVLQGMSEINHQMMMTMNVQVEGGAGYGVSRQAFADYCSDWNDNACDLNGDARSFDLELVLPPSALTAHSIVKTGLYATQELWYYDAQNGIGDGAWATDDDRGRHVVVAA